MATTNQYTKSLVLLKPTSYSIPFRMPGSQKDRQMMHYFCDQGASDICGFVKNDFWSRIVLQASHHDSIVRQALVALSSLHLAYTRTDHTQFEAARQSSLVQYGKTVRALHRQIASPEQGRQSGLQPIKTALVCCVIFHCFESTMGDAESALNHLRNGLQLTSAFNHKRDSTESRCDGDFDELFQTFSRLDIQASFFDDGRIPILNLASLDERINGLSTIPNAPFRRIIEAQESLTTLQNWLFRLLLENSKLHGLGQEHIPQRVQLEKGRLSNELDFWEQRFNEFILRDTNSETAGSSRDDLLCGRNTLFIHYEVSRMLLASKLPPNPEIFGVVPNTAAEEILRLADSVLQLFQGRATAQEAEAPRYSSSSETGIVAPLFVLAMKCADQAVCGRAVQILMASKRREGLYNAEVMIQIIGRLRVMENLGEMDMQEFDTIHPETMSLEHRFIDLLNQSAGGIDSILAAVS